MPYVPHHILLLPAALIAAAPRVAESAEPARARAASDINDATLAREARLEPILRLALTRNPDLAEDRARLRAARARARQAGRLPEVQLKYEQWGVPLRRPFALPEANAVMVGLSLTLPPAGAREARFRAADQEASAASASADSRRRDLHAQVRRAFAEYYRADREAVLHREHVELTERLVALTRSSYRNGQRTQQDVLRLSLELARLHRDVAHIEQERISAQSLLNALMGRPVDAALGPPVELEPPAAPDVSAEKARDTRHAELAAARAALSRSEAALAVARTEARWPSVTIGGDYMYMPMMEHRHGYGAMVMLNLPWLSAGRGDAIEAAEQALAADRQAVESVRNVLRYEARDARARFEAARSTFDIVDRDLLPQARRNFETTQASYGAGQGDALGLVDGLRTYLDSRLDRVRGLAHLETAAADLARALGEQESEQESEQGNQKAGPP
jgi:cobalt-zinc-cadmium efflux system outer membrane protein